MTAELFKQSHRPAAYIVGGSLNWLSNFTVGFVFPFLQVTASTFELVVGSPIGIEILKNAILGILWASTTLGLAQECHKQTVKCIWDRSRGRRHTDLHSPSCNDFRAYAKKLRLAW